MILTGPAIRAAFQSGVIEVDPFNEDQLNPASYDLRLGDRGLMYSAENCELGTVVGRCVGSSRKLLDSKREQKTTRFTIPDNGLIIEPGCLYLLHTAERLHTHCYATVIDGKSSIGRLGLVVHLTAGYGDPGFNGQYTLEVTSVAHPVIVYAGMRFCQARFQTLKGAVEPYSGNYQGDDATGPVASRSWKQFG